MAENEHVVSGFTRYLTGDPSTWATGAGRRRGSAR